MFHSLKTKFIFYFMGTELLFLMLIIGINFTSLERATVTLTDEKIAASSELFVKLIAAPVVTLDLATLDDALISFAKLDDVVAVKILDLKSRPISQSMKKERLTDKYKRAMFAKNVVTIPEKDLEYRLEKVDVTFEGDVLATAYILFDKTKIKELVGSNKTTTYMIFIFALLIAFTFAYFVGHRLGRSLNKAATIANSVAKEESVTITLDENRHDEVAQLFKALSLMKDKIEERTLSLNKSLKGLEQFLHALDHSAIVSKSDPKGFITYVNKKFCDISGYCEDELIGQPHSIIRHSDMDKQFFENMWRTLQDKKIFKGTIKNVKRDGTAYYVDSTTVPLLDMDDNIIEYISIRYDVTTIVDALNKATEAERIKGEFLSNMSHEIRTPLNAILGFVHILQKRLINTENITYVNTIEESSKTLLHVINDILDFSKIENGKLTITKHSFDPVESFTQTYKLFTLKADTQNIDFKLSIDPDIPKLLVGDLLRIQQIIYNFLSNAFKFTSEGKSIKMRVYYDSRDSMLYVSIEDEGIGLSLEHKKKIFHAFEQADGSTTRLYGGTGLGLSISLKLAELMDGNISVKSELGEGSTFSLSVKVEDKSETLETIPFDAEDGTVNFDGHLLVAEDNKTNQMLIKMLLDELGVTYTVVPDGLQAVDAFKNSDFDMVLMDENMPVMNGIVAVENIRLYEKEHNLNVAPIIAVTANVMQEDQERFKAVGMDDFVAKPIDHKELERVFKRFLQRK